MLFFSVYAIPGELKSCFLLFIRRHIGEFFFTAAFPSAKNRKPLPERSAQTAGIFVSCLIRSIIILRTLYPVPAKAQRL